MGRGKSSVMVTVKSPRPLNSAGAENERAGWMPIECKAMSRRPWAVRRTVVEKEGRDALARPRQFNESPWSDAVVDVFIPLVPQSAIGKHGCLTGPQRRDGRVSPEAQPPEAIGDFECERGHRAIHHEESTHEGILRPPAVCGRAEAWIAPGAGPDVRQRVDLGVGVCLLVRDERAIGRVGSVDTGFPSGL